MKKFEKIGVVTDIERYVRRRFTKKYCYCKEGIAEDPNVLIPRRYQELGLSCCTLRIILHLDLHLIPIKSSLRNN